jgi:hypothetical protein
VTLVRACAAAAVKASGKTEKLSKRDATKLMLQARVADLEKEIAQSKAQIQQEHQDRVDWEEQCAQIYEQAVESYEQQVEPFLRRAQNPFEPADQHQLQIRLAEVQQRIAESKKLLRQKLDDKETKDQANALLKQQETATHGLVGELTGVLSSHAQRRKALEAEMEVAVRAHAGKAASLQRELQQTIQANLQSRDALARELDAPLQGCELQSAQIEAAVAQIEAVVMQ